MEITNKSRRQLRLQGATFAALFLALIGITAWLSTQYHYQADWTAAGRNSLAPGSLAVLKKLDGPITITVFAREEESQVSRRNINDFLARYHNAKPDLTVSFINPDLHPEKVKEYGVMVEGEMSVEYQGRRENVQELTEQSITNALQRLARGGLRPLVFLTGHGERKSHGQANFDLGLWGEQLGKKGFSLSDLNLAAKGQLPDPNSVLVVSTPGVNVLPGEAQLLRNYIDKGGNLLWLGEPGELHGLRPLADALGVRFLPGAVMDRGGEQIGNPAFVITSGYPPHPITNNLGNEAAIFPTAAALEIKAPAGWEATPLLRTSEVSWNETSPTVAHYDAGKDAAGPLTIGVALTRELTGTDGTKRAQRVIVLGDGDFLTNSFVGNGINLDLGNRVVNWLSHDDSFIQLPARAAPDVHLEMGLATKAVIGFGFLLVIPGALFTTGIVIWLKRRKR